MKNHIEQTKQLNLFSHSDWWTDFELKVFVEEFLLANLGLLKSKKLPYETRLEVMDWVFNDDENVGLSFNLCCKILELDSENLRLLIKSNLN